MTKAGRRAGEAGGGGGAGKADAAGGPAAQVAAAVESCSAGSCLMEDISAGLASISTPAFALDSDHRVVAWNAACEAMTGCSRASMLGTKEQWRAFYPHERATLADLVVDCDREEMQRLYGTQDLRPAAYLAGSLRAEGWFEMPFGGRRYFAFEAGPVLDLDGDIVGAVETLHDLTAEKSSAEQLRLAASAFEKIADGIMITDPSNRIVSINQSFRDITGWGDEAIGEDPKILASDRHGREFYKAMWNELRSHGRWQGEIWNRRKNGEEYLVRMHIGAVVEDGETSHYVAAFSDITAHREDEERIRRLAHHDFLTGLPNRALLEDRMEQQLAQAKRTGRTMAVAFLDLDKFKAINDGLGHDAGDELLRAVSERLSSAVRSTDTVSRQGGDEFVLLMADPGDLHEIAHLATKIIEEVAKPVGLGAERQELSVTTSMGIAVFPDDGEDPADLLRNADAALYHAKRSGRNKFQFFTADLNAQAFESLIVEASLKAAIPNQLRHLLQPRVDLRTGDIRGCELLVRWQHPHLGLVSPETFIPLAEENGLIRELGRWVIDRAVDTILRSGIRTSVNVSAGQLRDPELISKLRDAAAKVGDGMLEVEITEGSFINDVRGVKDTLTAIRAMGVGVSLDDFGTGYSSLSYLRDIPADCVKIDRSFVADDSNREILLAVVDLCTRLGFEVVAEGVETEEQRDLLMRHGCLEGQGFLFSPPLEPDEFLKWAGPKRRMSGAARKKAARTKVCSWSSSMATGIVEIDREHQRLVEIAGALETSSGRERSLRAVEDLAAYTKYHFGREAALMKANALSMTTDHLREHSLFVERVDALRLAVRADPSFDPQKIPDLVMEWLREHILLSDMRLARELIAAGYRR